MVAWRTRRFTGDLRDRPKTSNAYFLGNCQCAEKNWRKLRGFAYLAKIVEGVQFINGEEIEQSDQVAA